MPALRDSIPRANIGNMVSYLIAGLLPLLLTFYFIGRRVVLIRTGTVVPSEGHDGILETKIFLDKVAMELWARIVRLWKLGAQYFFHLLVRVLSAWRDLSHVLYASARNQFLKNAVKNRESVGFFWDHLKEYKAQIEKEREDKGESKL